MSELKPKKSTESQKLEKQLQAGITKTITTLTGKVVAGTAVPIKKIEKWSKKLAKKVAKEVNANQPVATQKEPSVVKTPEKVKTIVEEKLAIKITPSAKKKSVAAAVK
jgi:hypothetical protein